MVRDWTEMDKMVRELGRLRLAQEQCRRELADEVLAPEVEAALTTAAQLVSELAERADRESEARAWQALAAADDALKQARRRPGERRAPSPDPQRAPDPASAPRRRVEQVEPLARPRHSRSPE